MGPYLHPAKRGKTKGGTLYSLYALVVSFCGCSVWKGWLLLFRCTTAAQNPDITQHEWRIWTGAMATTGSCSTTETGTKLTTTLLRLVFGSVWFWENCPIFLQRSNAYMLYYCRNGASKAVNNADLKELCKKLWWEQNTIEEQPFPFPNLILFPHLLCLHVIFSHCFLSIICILFVCIILLWFFE